MAAQRLNVELCKMLLLMGADPNQQNYHKKYETRSISRYTAR